MAVDDRLRLAGGARGEQHAQRVRERDRLEREISRFREQLGPGRRVGQCVRAVGDVHDVLDGRQPGADLGDLLAAVDVLGAVAVAGDGQQHLRLDLPEPVDHAAGAELRGAARPDRAQAGGGQERHQGLGDVRQVGHHPVAPADAEPLQARRGPVRPGRAAAPRSARPGRGSASSPTPPPHRRPIRVVEQPDRVLGVVQRSRPGTTARPASRAGPAPPRTGCGTGRRSAPRPPTRTRPGPRPTSGAAPSIVGEGAARVRAPARPGTGRSAVVSRTSAADALGRSSSGAAHDRCTFAAAALQERPHPLSWPRRCRPPRPPSATPAGALARVGLRDPRQRLQHREVGDRRVRRDLRGQLQRLRQALARAGEVVREPSVLALLRV